MFLFLFIFVCFKDMFLNLSIGSFGLIILLWLFERTESVEIINMINDSFKKIYRKSNCSFEITYYLALHQLLRVIIVLSCWSWLQLSYGIIFSPVSLCYWRWIMKVIIYWKFAIWNSFDLTDKKLCISWNITSPRTRKLLCCIKQWRTGQQC